MLLYDDRELAVLKFCNATTAVTAESCERQPKSSGRSTTETFYCFDMSSQKIFPKAFDTWALCESINSH